MYGNSYSYRTYIHNINSYIYIPMHISTSMSVFQIPFLWIQKRYQINIHIMMKKNLCKNFTQGEKTLTLMSLPWAFSISKPPLTCKWLNYMNPLYNPTLIPLKSPMTLFGSVINSPWPRTFPTVQYLIKSIQGDTG